MVWFASAIQRSRERQRPTSSSFRKGILEWADKDSKAKTVEIKLIPKALSVKMPDMSFKVELKPEPGDYVPVITVPMCEVILKNSGKYADAAAAYAAANKTKKASVTKDETAPHRCGGYGPDKRAAGPRVSDSDRFGEECGQSVQ